jgi:predicted TIM-barrel fold metal-dependent hydrolase
MAANDRPILGVRHTPPSFTVPKGACDCHTHVFGPANRYPWWSGRKYTPPDASIADLLAHQRAMHFDRVVIVHPSPYGTDNSCTLDAIRQIGPAARGVAVIGPETSETELQDMHAAGIRGVRLNLETAGQHDPAVARRQIEETAARVAPLGWHVQTYTSLAVLAPLHDAILALPTPLVVDHFGRAMAKDGVEQPGFDALLSLVRSGKAYVKISGAHRVSDRAPDFPDLAPIARALLAANPDRIVWGSDWPHPGGGRGDRPIEAIEPFHPEDDGRGVNRVAAWARGDLGLIRRVLVENPARLYDF